MKSIVVLLLAFVLSFSARGAEPGELIPLSDLTTPPVAYHLRRDGKNLQLTIDAAAFPASAPPALDIGITADKGVRLGNKDAKISGSRYQFTIPAARLVGGDAEWKKLRLAFAVSWPGQSPAVPRLAARFLHTDTAASHAGLSLNPADWTAIDLDEMEREAADRALQIHFDFPQPLDGKATVVINDESGNRIRNLISGTPMAKGTQRLVWDGLDENGNLAPPGNYHWKSISHPGLIPVHQLDFANGPGSNHATLQAAVAEGASLFFAAPVAEGGHEIIELDTDGNFKRGFNPPGGHGLNRVAIAADEKYLYAAHDGLFWGEHIDRSTDDWKETRTLSLMRLNRENFTIEEFPEKVRFAPIRKYEIGPGSASKLSSDHDALAGLTFANGKLYLADREANELAAIDPTTGIVAKKFPLTAPAALATSGDKLFAIADGKLQQINLASGGLTAIATVQGEPTGLTISAEGNFYISDSKDEVIRVLDPAGKPLKTLGHPGGVKPGLYDPLNLHHPAGLAISNGRLWVTEENRWQPKRLAAFDLKSGEVAKQFFGPTNYGAQGAGFDPLDETKWIGQDTLFDLDFKTGQATPKSILGGETGRRHTFYRQDGRTFIITSGKATYIQELLGNGTLKPLALISSAHQFAASHEWLPPEEFITAFKRDYPDVKYAIGKRGGIERGKPDHGYGMLWVDRDGDGKMQAAEIEFATAATNLAGAGWSHDFVDLTLKVPAEANGKKIMVTLKPDGFYPGGAPRYPALNDAVKAGIPVDLPGTNMVESTTDRFGDLILNSDPAMRAFSADGKLLWTYPNRWSNVHGSHDSPLPKPGQLQGSLFFSGVVPLDETSDVMLINGNHGRAFAITSDGLYLDEMFPDVRMMKFPQASGIGILGGECFGGTFGKSAKDGNYYFQGGGIAYRVYRIDGLRDTHRNQGNLTVTPQQSASADRAKSRLAATTLEPKSATIRSNDTPVVGLQWSKEGKFPVTVNASYTSTTLNLTYTVRDDSPWINNGKDWQMLFKTGDGIDLQLATDPTANPKRGQPVPGDLRLFIAPSGNDNIAVLYRHRVPNANPADSVVFQSPWRSEKVDVVKRLDSAKIKVTRKSNEYTVEAEIPLTELNLTPTKGQKLRGDFGVIYGDPAGTTNVFRNYWSNQSTGLVNDVPGEIMLTPNLWSDLIFQ
jgi:hypothetical protein